MTLQLGLIVFVGLAATIEDIARRQVSNWIPVTGLLGGLICQAITGGWAGVGNAALGALLGFSIFFVRYQLFGMGGGDVKLMGGLGAILGWRQVLWATLWSALLGGFIALMVIGVRSLRRRGQLEPSAAETDTMPYAPAIALGALLAMVPTG